MSEDVARSSPVFPSQDERDYHQAYPFTYPHPPTQNDSVPLLQSPSHLGDQDPNYDMYTTASAYQDSELRYPSAELAERYIDKMIAELRNLRNFRNFRNFVVCSFCSF